MADKEFDILRKAGAGLLYPSETDTPFTPVRFAALKDMIKDRPVRKQSLNEFFDELVTGEDGAKFLALRKALEGIVKNPQVLRIGSRSVDIYLIGQTKSGDYAGLHTISVET